MMRVFTKVVLGAAGTIAIFSMIGFFVVALGQDADTPPIRLPVETPSERQLAGAMVIPTVMPGQVQDAEEILANDERAITLLKGMSYTIVESGPVVNSNHELTGIHLRITLDAPIPVEGVWPVSGHPEGLEVASCAAPGGVQDLFAVVDLQQGELVTLGIGPGSADRPTGLSYGCETTE